jgi:hypothetical protein
MELGLKLLGGQCLRGSSAGIVLNVSFMCQPNEAEGYLDSLPTRLNVRIHLEDISIWNRLKNIYPYKLNWA